VKRTATSASASERVCFIVNVAPQGPQQGYLKTS